MSRIRYRITIYVFDKKTREITQTASLKTIPITKDRLELLIKEEMMKYPNSCYAVND